MPRKNRKSKHTSREQQVKKVTQRLQDKGIQIGEVQYWKKNKLSDAIEKLIEPFQAETHSYDEYYSLIGFACTAWNISLLNEAERGKSLDEFIEKSFKLGTPIEVKMEIQNFVSELIQSKLELFSTDNRFIVNFELEDRGKDFYLSIASALSTSADQ